MTDHRATDLCYGHLGEATYDNETGEWCFSLDPFSQSIQQIRPLSTGIRLPTQSSPPTISAPKDRTKSTKALVKSRPETFPAGPLLLSLPRLPAPAYPRTQVGQLLGVGMAVDVEQTFGSRKTTVIVTSCGEAGHVLRLIKPRVEIHEWGGQSSARLSLFDVGSQDAGFWVGIGGRILQIVFAEDGNVPTTWLAVRQVNSTTIFRPRYGAIPTPAVVPSGFMNSYPSSRLNANPVAVLTAEQSGSRSHVDVTFNPWYTQQFAVVDELGTWTTWDIEGGRRKNTFTRLIPGKRANIFDGYVPDSTLKAPDNADGWHKILWIGTVSTIVICNRRHLALFDIKAAPIRLPSRDFFAVTNSDWIVDVKRSTSNSAHLFVLSSSRLFWLEVRPAREDRHGSSGFRVLISHRHFRDANDRSLRISIINDDKVSISISSRKSNLVNIYTFTYPDELWAPKSSHGSLDLSKYLNDKEMVQSRFLSLQFLEAPLKAIPNRPSSPEIQYENVKFYQILVLTSELAISSGLCSMQVLSPQSKTAALQVKTPRRTYLHTPGYTTSKRVVEGPWIVSDDQIDDESAQSVNDLSHRSEWATSGRKGQDDSRLTINFRSIYEQAYPVGSLDKEQLGFGQSMGKLLESALERIRQGKQHGQLSLTTLLELSQVPGPSVDLEQGAPVLHDFLESLRLHEAPDSSSDLVLSNLTLCPGSNFQEFHESQLPDLLKVYDQVADNWITSLPLRLSGLTRLAKFKIARKVAVELCLSSIGISLRSKAVHLPWAAPTETGEELPILSEKSAATSRAGSPALFSSQNLPSSFNEPSFGLPTPAQTPSLYSQSHTSASEYTEDPAITRLRQYALIKDKPDLGTSKILSHWPERPGADPATYSWEKIQKKAAEKESGEEADHRRRREGSRRKRRMERFLSRESTVTMEPNSQPAFAPFGSQPGVQRAASSQNVADDVPMTQPVGGAFGSRSAQQGKKKQNKKRTAGFR